MPLLPREWKNGDERIESWDLLSRTTAPKTFPSLILFVQLSTRQVFSLPIILCAHSGKEGGGGKEKEFSKKFHGEKGQAVRAGVTKRRGGQAPRKVERRREQFREVWPGQMGKLRFEEILNYSQRFETVHPCFTQ